MIININDLDEIDLRFMNLATYVSEWSLDPRTKVGAVLVNQNNQVVGVDCNHFPKGVAETHERLHNKEEKLKFVVHAERNTLDNCATNVSGYKLYVTLQPCVECAKSIIQRGIAKVTCIIEHDKHAEFVNYSLRMMIEAGIEVTQVEL